MTTTPANPFAPNPASSPFAAGSDGKPSTGRGMKLAPTPVGVLRGTVTELKETAKGSMLLVKCDDPTYADADPIMIWIGNEMHLLVKIAGALGIVTEIKDGMVYFSDEAGNVDGAAFKGKPGLFVFAPSKDGAPGINKFGLPKEGISPMWDQYASEADFTKDQLAALKKATGGVVPGDLHHLFG